MPEMLVHAQRQLNPVSDEVSALTAVVRPILKGVLYSLKQDVVAEVGGYDDVKLKMLPRLRRPGDGDCGVCFEYAVHEAICDGDPRVIERLVDASRLCNVSGANPASILLGLEKNGALQLINTASQILTDASKLLSGAPGQPINLRRHLQTLADSFSYEHNELPLSIKGLWKADLFFGFQDTDRWVGTTVKINPHQLEGAPGLRIGIVPVRQGMSDIVRTQFREQIGHMSSKL